MILITGAAGFIASCLVHSILRADANVQILAVDDFSQEKKSRNFDFPSRVTKVGREELFAYLDQEDRSITQIYHLGARTDTVEKSEEIFNRLNLEYSKKIWKYASKHHVDLLYASSAATYGNGEFGFVDNHASIDQLEPLNAYGESKQKFDQWALTQSETPPHWFGVKFFNVYGPNEYHKGRMASVIFHSFHQIKQTEGMKLFKSHREDFADGQQSRDFIYVDDVIKVCKFLLDQSCDSGIYNIGTGKARSFYDLASNVFHALDLETNISYIDTPLDLREKYQYFTEANMLKLKEQGYDHPFMSLEEGIKKYVQNYLVTDSMY